MLTPSERRIFTDYENRRELAEVGQDCDATCGECFEDVSGEGDAFTVLGVAMCPGCAIDEISRLRQEEWGALTEADHIDLLEELAGAAGRERSLAIHRLCSLKAVQP